jgi:hypothetical protein
MNRYIHQLIEDLEEAIVLAPNREIFADNYEFEGEDEEDETSIAFIEHYLYGEQIELGKIVGIEQILLPPIEKLNKKQSAKILPYLLELLSAYGFELDFPDNVPPALKYKLIRQVWMDKFVPVKVGIQTIEFCDYDCDFCPFGSELCQCKEFEKMCV